MAEKSKVNERLELKTDDLGKTIVIRYDEPKKVYEPKAVIVKGSIYAPSEFWKKRKTEYELKEVNVVYNTTKGEIQLRCNERSQFADIIDGKLELNPRLKALDINGKERSISDFIKLLRFNTWIFKNETDQKRVVDKLTRFKADVMQKITNNNDQRGNIDEAFVQRVNTTADMSFTAECSVYVGIKPVKFKVDIVCEVRNAAIGFWMESTELAQLIDTLRDDLMHEQIGEFKDVVCIEQ